MKKILLVLLLLSIIFSSPSIMLRANTEMNNRTYEIVVPYEEMATLTKHGINVYEQLQGRVQAVSIEPTITLQSLEESGDIQIFRRDQMPLFDGVSETIINQNSGLYFINKNLDKNMMGRINQAFNGWLTKETEMSQALHEEVYFIKGFDQEMVDRGGSQMVNPILLRPLGFDFAKIAKFHEFGFATVLRVGNNISSDNIFIFDDLVKLNKLYGDDKLLFSGNEALSLENEQVKERIIQLKELGFSIMPIELNPQKGFAPYEKLFGNQVIRLHSINPFSGQGGEIDRASRAVNERNIRTIFLHITSWDQFTSSPDQVVVGFDRAVSIIDGIHEAIGKQKYANFKPGNAVPFPSISQPIWIKFAIVVGISVFAGLAALVMSKRLSYVAIAGMGLLGLAYLFTGISAVAQLLALLVAIIAATYAVVSAEHVKTNIVWQFIKSIAIGLVGAWFVIALLFGNEFMVKFVEFRGIKILFLGPILLVFLHFMRHSYKKLAMEPIRFYHLGLLGLFGLAAAIYLMRSGNNPALGASGIEMQVRSGLENFLGVRPRTKEFLIGYPLFILAMYLVAKGEKWARYLYIGAAVGFVSMVNTFTHLHIPLYISLIRTINGAIIGLLFGLLFIVIYRFCVNKIWPKIQARL